MGTLQVLHWQDYIWQNFLYKKSAKCSNNFSGQSFSSSLWQTIELYGENLAHQLGIEWPNVPIKSRQSLLYNYFSVSGVKVGFIVK